MSTEFQDKQLTCAEKDCGPFTFTAGEQKFYHDKGMASLEQTPWTPPKRCKKHRDEMKARREGKTEQPRRESDAEMLGTN